ncbi:MAG: DUF1641 domain-containing protein [Acidimicrobiia bacterium]
MTESATLDRTAHLEEKIDLLTEQVQFLTAEASAQRMRRIALEELQADLTPIAAAALARSADTLDDAQIDPADLVQLGIRVAANARMLEGVLVQLEALNELAADAKPIVNQGVELAISQAARFEEKGYFAFAEATAGIVDRIVTTYTKEDVEALGDNVVQILEIVKDLTQPQMLAVAQRLLDVVQRQAEINGSEPEDPPGLFALAGKMRDPEIRRGMGRALDTFKAVSAADAPPVSTKPTDTTGGA